MTAKFEIKKTTSGMYYFSLRAENGENIFSSETYETRNGCENGIRSVVKNASNDLHYDHRGGEGGGETYFVLRADNNEIIGRSETYSSIAAMEKGIEAVKANARTAVIVDTTV